MSKHVLAKYRKTWHHSIVSGFAWAIGVSLGFAFVSSVLVTALSFGVGLPFVGGIIAGIVEATNSSLITRTPTP